jgi:hypothetical protein
MASSAPCVSPRDYAIVVGIDKYDVRIPPLRGSGNDSRLFKEWLERRDGGGLDPKHIVHLTNLGIGRPASDEIEDEFMQLIDRSTTEGRPVGRRLYIYMAGHGVIPAPPLHNDCGLVMANARPNLLRAMPGRLVAEIIQRSAIFEEVVLFMDCCREVNGATKIQMDLPDISDPTIQPPPAVFAFAAKWSSTAAERLLPHPFDRTLAHAWQGIFTHTLLKGLGSAIDESGRVTSLSLRDFVRRGVQELLPADDNRRPEFVIDEDRPAIDFGEGLPFDVKLTPTVPGRTFQLLDGDLNPIEPVNVTAAGAKTYRLYPGLYLIESPGLEPKHLRVMEGPVDESV